MVDGLDTIWNKEGRDTIDERMLEDAVEIMTAVVIGWYSDKGMVRKVTQDDLSMAQNDKQSSLQEDQEKWKIQLIMVRMRFPAMRKITPTYPVRTMQ